MPTDIQSKSIDDNVIKISGIRKKNLPYILVWIIYYAWVIVFATWWTASPVAEVVFDSDTRSIIHAVILLSSAVFVFIIKKEHFVIYARVGAICAIVSMIAVILVPFSLVSKMLVIFVSISLGCINAGILIPFVFKLNNTEKFYSVVASNLLINILSLSFSSDTEVVRGVNEMLFSYIFLLSGLICIIFFKKDSLDSLEEKTPESDIKQICCEEKPKSNLSPSIYLTIVFNCIFAVLCKGAAKGVLNISVETLSDRILLWYYLGGIAGCLLYVIIFGLFIKSIHLTWNITFASLSMGLLFNAFSAKSPGLSIGFAIFLGLGSTIGMINMYYILGVVGKKYNSMIYVRKSILYIGICGGVAGVVIGNLIDSVNAFDLALISSVASAAVMLILLILSPVFTSTHYAEEWVQDSERVEIDNEKLYIFRQYKLTNREIEVCKLLLQGYTLRQISAMMNIAYSTVNTYCTAIYRKLSINSRTELLLMFKDYVC